MPTFSFVNVVASRINLTTTITGTVDFGSVDPPLNWYIQGVTNDLKPGSQSGQIGSVNGSFNFSFTVLDTGSSSTVNLILKNTSGSPDIWANRSVSISGSGSISAPIISTSSIDSTNVIIFHNPVSNATEYSLEAFTPDYPQWIMYPFSPMNITNGRIEYPFTLSSDGTYVFRVRAKNSTSTSLYSNESQVTKNTTATATITLTVAKSVYLIGTSSTVDLSWNSIPNATSYTLQFQELGSTIWKAFGVFTNTFAVVSGMSTNTEYKFRVTVGNVISNIVTVSTTITPTPTPTPIMPDIDWINTSFADNIKLTDNVLTGTIFASKTNKWDASFNPNMKMIVQVFDNNNNQVDTFFYSFFFDSAVTASFSLSKNYSYSAITVKLVVQDTNFNTYSVITSKSLTNVIVTGDDTTVINTMVSQSPGLFVIENNRLKGEILFIANSNFNSYYYGKQIQSIIEVIRPDGTAQNLKTNYLTFTNTERDERILFDEYIDVTSAKITSDVVVSLSDSRMFSDRKIINTGLPPITDPINNKNLLSLLGRLFTMGTSIGLLVSKK
ncbi:MAG TPA: fibronectin type III domain-containing protein [Nitrosarchaeum sp.]